MAAPAHSAATNTLIDKASSIEEHIAQMADLLTYITSTQKLTVVAPLRALGHPATALLEEYAANGFQVEVGSEWSLKTIQHTTGNGPHSSTLSSDSTAFCGKKILEWNHQGFIIVLLVTESIALFGTTLRISCLASPRLIRSTASRA